MSESNSLLLWQSDCTVIVVRKGCIIVKFKKSLMAIVLVVAVIFAAIPAYAVDYTKSTDEMTMREKVWYALGHEPDHYFVLLDGGAVEVSEEEFYTIADKLKNDTFDDAKYAQRVNRSWATEESTLYEEYYDFTTHSVSSTRAGVTETITPHTIKANTFMWYGDGYYMKKEGLLTFQISFSAKPTNANAVLKEDGKQTKSSNIGLANYSTAYIAGKEATYNPGVENLASSSISVTGGEITCIP